MKFQKASFWQRLTAYLIDVFIFAVPDAIIRVVFEIPESEFFFEIVTYLYFILMEANFQRTVGKHLMGLKVMKTDGRRPNLSTCFWRNAARLLSMFHYLIGGYVRILAPHQIQTIHDEFAGCLVVREIAR